MSFQFSQHAAHLLTPRAYPEPGAYVRTWKRLSEATDEEVAILKEVVDLDPLDGDALLLLRMHASPGGDKEQASF